MFELIFISNVSMHLHHWHLFTPFQWKTISKINEHFLVAVEKDRSMPLEVFLRKVVLKIGKYTGEHPCESVTSVKLL